METEKLYKILKETTKVYRKGIIAEEGDFQIDYSVTRVVLELFFGIPYNLTPEAIREKKYKKVDMIFIDVLVDKQKAEERKQQLENVLAEYPQPERLAGGPSYIELSPNCGLEQEGGLRLMALGKVLGLWKIINGKTCGLNEKEAKELAGRGFLMISGYSPGGRK